jgi:hypothetical protein
MIGFIDTSFTQLGTIGNHSAIADLHTLQLNVIHALRFFVFTSRILATDFITASLSLHEVFFSQPNSFLAIILQPPIPKTQFNSSALKLISWQAGASKLDSTELFFITALHGPRRKHSLSCWKGVFTAPLHSERSYSIVACVFVAAGMCLPSRCLAMDVCSEFTIPAFGCHVTLISGLNVGLYYPSTPNILVADSCKTLVPVDLYQELSL